MSGFAGVSWHKQRMKWKAEIREDGRQNYLGYFADKAAAARAWDGAARRQGLTEVNFPRRGKGETKVKPQAKRSAAQVKAAKAKGGGPSEYVGVRWHRHGKWEAYIRDGGIRSLGLFESEKAAAEAYDEAARPLGKKLNFPKRGETKAKKKQPPRKPEQIAAARVAQGGEPSEFTGVSWDAQSGRWQAAITHGGTKVHLGRFDDEGEAARAYNLVAARLRGPKARLNDLTDATTSRKRPATASATEASSARKRRRVSAPPTAPVPAPAVAPLPLATIRSLVEQCGDSMPAAASDALCVPMSLQVVRCLRAQHSGGEVDWELAEAGADISWKFFEVKKEGGGGTVVGSCASPRSDSALWRQRVVMVVLVCSMFFNDNHCAPELNLRDPAANAPTLDLVSDTSSVTIAPPASVNSIGVIELPCFRSIPEADVQRSKGTRRVRKLESASFSFEKRVCMPI
eukprot:COSAG04_NODE_891_length_9607_cov_13.087085_11_plen_457_part_00